MDTILVKAAKLSLIQKYYDIGVISFLKIKKLIFYCKKKLQNEKVILEKFEVHFLQPYIS